MGEAGIGALLARTLLSLAVVLAIVGIGYVIARRRAGRSAAPAARPRVSMGSLRRKGRPSSPLEVVGRVGLSRTSALVAVRFGERVVLVTAVDGAPSSVVTEMSAEQWDELHTVREAIDPAEFAAMSGPVPGLASAPAQPVSTSLNEVTKPGFVEALRQATARYA